MVADKDEVIAWPLSAHREGPSTSLEGEQMMHRTLVALLVVLGLVPATPAQAAPSPTRAAGATSAAAVQVAAAASYAEYASFLAQLESYRSKLKAHDKSYGEMLANYVLACPTAKHMAAVDPQSGQIMWRDISKAARIDHDFNEETIDPPIAGLLHATQDFGKPYADFLDFFKHHNDNGRTYRAELLAGGGLALLRDNPSANCDKAISGLTTATGMVIVEAEKSLDTGFKQLESLKLPK